MERGVGIANVESVERGVGSGVFGVWRGVGSGEFGVEWGVGSGMWRLECGVRRCGDWSLERGAGTVECGGGAWRV